LSSKPHEKCLLSVSICETIMVLSPPMLAILAAPCLFRAARHILKTTDFVAFDDPYTLLLSASHGENQQTCVRLQIDLPVSRLPFLIAPGASGARRMLWAAPRSVGHLGGQLVDRNSC